MDAHSLQVPASFGHCNERLIGDFGAVGDVQTLQSRAMFGNSPQSMIRDGIEACYVQGQEAVAPIHNRHYPMIRQSGTAGQGEPLDPLAAQEWLDCSIANLITQVGQVEAFDEGEVWVIAAFFPYRLHDVQQMRPGIAKRSMP